MITIAHLSDTHFGGPPHARQRAERVVAHLLAMEPRPDVLLVTGDVADHGAVEEYAVAREVFAAWPGLRLIVPGNHDVRSAFLTGLFDSPGEVEGTCQELVVDGARFVGLDSLVSAPPGERIDHGELDDGSLLFLEECLSQDDRPAFVCLHHPPVDIGLGLMAPILLRDPEPIAATIARHPHVVATLVGHAHTACVTTFAGRPLIIGGGVASTVPLDAEDTPVVWEDAPPSFALHLLDDHGRLTTHWRSLP